MPDEMTLVEKAQLVNKRLRTQKVYVDTKLPQLVHDIMTETDQGHRPEEGRKLAANIASVQGIMPSKDWEVGMTTNPGDLVFNPENGYHFIYSGESEYTHTNPLFYPGAQGVYYWQIVPHFDLGRGVNVYPELSGITVSVKKGELWYNPELTHIYEFIGEDNANCVWAPGTAPTLWKEVE